MHPTTLQLNTTDILRDELDIARQVRTNPLPWKGQFSPQLVEVLLREYAEPGCHVLDPFAGSGTVLGEAVRQGHSATGIEINPAAVILAKQYELANASRDRRHQLFQDVRASIVRWVARLADNSAVGTLRPQDFAVAARRARDPEKQRLLQAVLVLADPKWGEVPLPRVWSAYERLRDFAMSLPEGSPAVSVLQADARALPLAVGSVDIVVTSPPYINVFNYHQQYRPAVEALDHDVLEAARSEIGSNRKHRMNRFLTVVQYALDMSRVVSEAGRVLRPGGRAVFVVGRESRVRGARIPNGKLLSQIFSLDAGFSPLMRQERSFRNRFGESIVEDILHFTRTHGESAPDPLRLLGLAVSTLEALLPSVEGEVRRDVLAAIESAASVLPSPLLERSANARF